jgi:two-component system chemotaxis response regulator CheY
MSLNLLIVDDSAVMRAMVLKTLRMANLPLGEVHQAANGAEGLAQLQEHWIDLCLVDINMPVMDGEQMIRAVRGDRDLADLPIIVISTESSQTRISRLMEAGVTFVHKPFTPEMVRQIIKESLGDYGDTAVGSAFEAGDGTDF